jgi:hypothetical protein
MPATPFELSASEPILPNDRPRHFLQRLLGLCLTPGSGPLRSIAYVENDGELRRYLATGHVSGKDRTPPS